MEERSRSPFVRTIFFCCNERDPGEAACANRGARDLQAALKQHVKDRNLKHKIRVMRSTCMDLCAEGPNVCIQPDNVFKMDDGLDGLDIMLGFFTLQNTQDRSRRPTLIYDPIIDED